MAGTREKLEMGSKEDLTKALLGEEITDLLDDGLEGSNDERQIFMEVFCGNCTVNARKRCSSQSSAKDILIDDVCSNENCRHANVKRIKQSDKPLNHDIKTSNSCLSDDGKDLVQVSMLKDITSSASTTPGLNCNGEITTGHLVESSSQGIISRCILIRHHGEIDNNEEVHDHKTSNKSEIASPPSEAAKETNECEVILSPVSQESFTCTLLPTVAMNGGEEKPVTLSNVEKRSKDCDLVMSNTVDVAWTKACTMDLRTSLRRHVNYVLVTAGWRIETRKRNTRSSVDTVYKTPNRRITFTFSKAWALCGESLFAGGMYATEEDARQWKDIAGFWCDLSEILAHIEEDMQQIEPRILLSHRWSLLNPFVTVVFIERKIGLLKAGRAVKAVKGVAIDLSDKTDVSLVAEDVDVIRSQPVDTFGGQSACLDQSLVPAKSDSTLSQLDPCLNDIPLLTSNVETVIEGNKDVSLHHGDDGSFSILSEKNGRTGDFNLASTFGRSNQIPFHDEESERNLRSLARSYGNGSSDAGDLNSMVQHFSASEEKRSLRSSCNRDVIDREATLSQLKDTFMNGRSAQHSAEPYPEPSLFTALKRTGNVFMDVTTSCMLARELTPPNLNVQMNRVDIKAKEQMQENIILSRHSEHCEHSITEQQLPLVHLQEEDTCHEMRRPCKEEVLARENDVSTINVVTMQPEINSSVCQSNLSKEVLCVVTKEDKIADMDLLEEPTLFEWMCSKDLHQPQYLTEETDTAQGMSNFVREDASTATEIGLGDVSIIEKPVSFVHLVENSQNLMDENCSKEEHAHENSSNTVRGATMQLELQVPVHNCSSVGDVLSGSMDDWVEASKRKNDHFGTSQVVSAPLENSNLAEIGMHLVIQPTECLEEELGIAAETSGVDTKGTCEAEPQIGLRAQMRRSKRIFKIKGTDVSSEDKQTKFKCKNNLDEAHLLNENNESVPVDTQSCTRTPKVKNHEVRNTKEEKKSRGCGISDDDLLISAIIRNGEVSSNSNTRSRSRAVRELKSQNASCRLLLRTPGKGGKPSQKSYSRVKIVLAWLIDVGVVSVNDSIQYRSQKGNEVVKDGRIKRDGILCKCCKMMFSVSMFKLHAGCKLNRPNLNLFVESGEPLILRQLQAWNAEYRTRKGGNRVKKVDERDQNDDTCGRCGDGGDLICCDNCPSTFHLSCLSIQELPEGSWYCPNCTCLICGDVATEKENSSALVTFKCSQCERKYHNACINEKGMQKGIMVSDTWFCGENCQELYTGLRSLIGVSNNISDGFSWTLLRCIISDQKINSAKKIAMMAECNTKLAVSLSIMEESFLPMLDRRTGISMIPQVLYNWGSEFPRLSYEGFHTVVLEKDDELISVASIRVHGVMVAEMPLIATCAQHRRQGMCRLLMSVIEEMLKSFKVEKLVLTAIPDLVDTWMSGFGFKPLEDKEREELNSIKLMVFPGTIWLKKNLSGTAAVKPREACNDDLFRTRGSATADTICAFGEQETCYDGTDMEAVPALPDLKHFRPVEQVACQQKDFTEKSPGKPDRTTVASEDQDVYNIECCGINAEILDKSDKKLQPNVIPDSAEVLLSDQQVRVPGKLNGTKRGKVRILPPRVAKLKTACP